MEMERFQMEVKKISYIYNISCTKQTKVKEEVDKNEKICYIISCINDWFCFV